MTRRTSLTWRSVGPIAAVAATLAACEGGGKSTVQVGYRGVGEEANYDNSDLRKSVALNRAPAPLPPAGPSVPGQWQNVQVLTDVSASEFTRTMTAMSEWVAGSPTNCAYCHSLANFASDSLYTKVVARRMLQMTRHVNTEWRAHVAKTGVTCYTCHRGQPVPAGIWHYTDENQYLRAYLDRSDVRVQSYSALPTADNRSSIKQTENTYGLMIGMSRALGVNCTFCHNSRSWATWQNGPPARVTALYGLRMTRDLNTEYLSSLGATFPAVRRGPLGDAPKLQCLTCHQGVFKPLYGASMAKDYPALWGHGGPWDAPLPSDTAAAGIVNLRGADSIPTDASPRVPAIIPHSRPAPRPGIALAPGTTVPGTPSPVTVTPVAPTAPVPDTSRRGADTTRGTRPPR